tara:strand:+ start:2279 stop:2782 length:504 start_codon:yes stop_codon:yes gene_type:complete
MTRNGMETVSMSVARMHEHRDDEVDALDPLTHSEMCLLYRESADSIRFAKTKQWRSLGATLAMFAGLMAVGSYNADNALFVELLMLTSVLLSCGLVYVLVIFQNWQNTEREKLRFIAHRLSAMTRTVRGIKSHQEANMFRYLLLSFMILTLLLGNAVALAHLAGLQD